MDVKEAVRAAKQYVGELFDDEDIKNLGLEEVEYDESAGVWRVTVGFSGLERSTNIFVPWS